MYSGTTACVVLLRNNKLYISNCGDSRAVLARSTGGSGRRRKRSRNENNNGDGNGEGEGGNNETKNANLIPKLTTMPLSIDQNPDSPGEKERILQSGGFVSPPPEPGLSSRVWLDVNHTQIGLAMARSIGDHAVKGVGVIAEPVVSMHDLCFNDNEDEGDEWDEEEDEFMIIATDGVWEFISSEDAVDIVAKHLYANDDNGNSAGGGIGNGISASINGSGIGGASIACEALIKAASEKWHEHEGDYRDDITAIVVKLKDLWK